MKQKLMQFFKQNKKGFTLLELLIVVAILGVLVLIYMPNFDAFKKADGVVLNQQGKSVESSIAVYALDNPDAPDAYTLAAPAAGDLAKITNKGDYAQVLNKELGVTPALTGPTLDAWLTANTKFIDPAKLKIQGSKESLKDFLVVTDPASPASGAVLSIKLIKDKKGVIYVGAYSTK